MSSPSVSFPFLQANEKAREVMHELESKGQTAIALVVDRVARAVFGLADEVSVILPPSILAQALPSVAPRDKLCCCCADSKVRPESAATIKALHRARFQVFMLTGDNRTTARMIAEQLNIPAPRVLAEVLPQHKAEKVEQLQVGALNVLARRVALSRIPAATSVLLHHFFSLLWLWFGSVRG